MANTKYTASSPDYVEPRTKASSLGIRTQIGWFRVMMMFNTDFQKNPTTKERCVFILQFNF